ncbi:hypothetical protein DLD99_01085 [Pseudomonas kribbensis]|uniref:Uncharacterized protein n=1 Tax=Pseudomonas kribbensis TaxID=1628086 RepID=A0A345RIK6_9PSED|nr:hypothetical protein DLD99_01085 [Pseudomonas kribbensis]
MTVIVPTLRVGMPQWTLCVRFGTQSVPGCIPTQSVGTISQTPTISAPLMVWLRCPFAPTGTSPFSVTRRTTRS